MIVVLSLVNVLQIITSCSWVTVRLIDVYSGTTFRSSVQVITAKDVALHNATTIGYVLVQFYIGTAHQCLHLRQVFTISIFCTRQASLTATIDIAIDSTPYQTDSCLTTLIHASQCTTAIDITCNSGSAFNRYLRILDLSENGQV